MKFFNLKSIVRTFAAACLLTVTNLTASAGDWVPVQSTSDIVKSEKYILMNNFSGKYVKFQAEGYTETNVVNATTLVADIEDATLFTFSGKDGEFRISDGEHYIVPSTTQRSASEGDIYYWNTMASEYPAIWDVEVIDGVALIGGMHGDWKYDGENDYVYIDGNNSNTANHCEWSLLVYDPMTVELDNQAASFSIPTDMDEIVKVKLYRKALTQGTLNTLCLPFDVDHDAFLEVFGNGSFILEYDEKIGDYVYLKYTMGIKAGKPYLIIPGDAHEDNFYVFPRVKANSFVSEPEDDVRGDFAFKGTFVKLTPAPTNFYIYNKGTFYHYDTAVSLAGTMAYFQPVEPSSQAKILGSYISENNGTATGISTVVESQVLTAPVYNVNGQVVRSSSQNLEGLVPGIYVVNGRKVVIK